MGTASTLLSCVLAAAPETSAPTEPVTPAPTVEADEYTTPDGRRTRWASATYLLPDGKFAEVFITVDDAASGEASIFVDGEAIVSSSFDERRGVSTWTSPEPGTGDLAAAAMTAIADRGSSELLDAFHPDDPQAFPCSDYGKKVLWTAGLLWTGASYAAGAACCIGATAATAVGCIGCASAVGIVSYAGSKALDGYCD